MSKNSAIDSRSIAPRQSPIAFEHDANKTRVFFDVAEVEAIVLRENWIRECNRIAT